MSGVLEVGKRCRLEPTEKGLKHGKKRVIGDITSITPRLILIKTNRYNTTYSFYEAKAPLSCYLEIWSGREWERLSIDKEQNSFIQE